MIYQYDLALPMPTKDLYDTQIMLMAVAAAKDMYEKGEKALDDFYSKYEDFYSPIAKDMEFVHNETVGKIKSAIDEMYARGEDPLRSQEGRIKLAQLRRSINTAAIARATLRAKNAELYYKNMGELRAKGLYNEDFSKFLGEDPSQWGDNFTGITSPTAYDDLNAHTTHWFDKINRNAYLYTDENGYDYTGVRPEDLSAVMDLNIPDFLNSDYGRYLLLLAGRQLGPNASQLLIIDQVKKNIISANKEMVLSPSRELSKERELLLKDYYDARKAAREFDYAKRLASVKGNGGNSGSDVEYDSAEGLFYRGLIHSGGADSFDDPNEAVMYARDNIIDHQLLSYRTARRMYGTDDKKMFGYVISSASILESKGDFANYLSRPVSDKNTDSVDTIAGDENNLYSEEYLVSHLYGLRESNGHSFKQGGEGVRQGQRMVPTTNVPTLFFKDTDGQYKIGQFWEVYVVDTDDSGDAIAGTGKKLYMKLPGTRSATTNMPEPSKRRYVNENGVLDSKYRPNIDREYSTKGLKNTGSRKVNKTIGVSTKDNLNSTVDPETVRR